jgi:hypothetical protein
VVREAVAALKAKVLDIDFLSDIDSVMGDIPFPVVSPFVRDEVMSGHVSGSSTCGFLLFPWDEGIWMEYDLDPQHYEVTRLHLFSFLSMALDLKHMLDRGELPAIRQVVIEERGEKTRMVTPVTACVVYISMFLNKVLLSMLDRDPRLDPKNPSPMDSFREKVQAASTRGYVLRSVDMSRATDLMPLDLTKSLVEGILDEVAWTPFLKDALRLCTGPMKLFPFGNGSETFLITTRAILMGLGTSWPLLSLYNLGLWERAWTVTGQRRVVSKRNRGILNLVGDDALGLVPVEVSKAYTVGLQATGGSPSQGKDLESSTDGVLVEELCSVTQTPSEGLKNSCIWLKTGSIRPLLPGISRDRDTGLILPEWMMGPQLTVACRRLYHQEAAVRWCNYRYGRARKMLMRAGVPPSLPRDFGGGGFPFLTADKAFGSLRPQWARAVRCALSQPDGGVQLSLLVSSWSLPGNDPLTQSERERWVSEASEGVRNVGLRGSVVDGDPTPSECGQLALASVANAMRVFHFLPKELSRPRLSQVVRKLTQSITTLNGLVPWEKFQDRLEDSGGRCHGWYRLLRESREPVHRQSLIGVTKAATFHLGPPSRGAGGLDDLLLWESFD